MSQIWQSGLARTSKNIGNTRFLGQDKQWNPLFHFSKTISRDKLAEDVKTYRPA